MSEHGHTLSGGKMSDEHYHRQVEIVSVVYATDSRDRKLEITNVPRKMLSSLSDLLFRSLQSTPWESDMAVDIRALQLEKEALKTVFRYMLSAWGQLPDHPIFLLDVDVINGKPTLLEVIDVYRALDKLQISVPGADDVLRPWLINKFYTSSLKANEIEAVWTTFPLKHYKDSSDLSRTVNLIPEMFGSLNEYRYDKKGVWKKTDVAAITALRRRRGALNIAWQSSYKAYCEMREREKQNADAQAEWDIQAAAEASSSPRAHESNKSKDKGKGKAKA